ncbi:MAG: SulP family inorganic anion transporter, partial [Spirochaetota bacterium]
MNTSAGSTVPGDIYGGITTAVISLPMALTFGIVSGAGAIAGLYGAIVVGLFAAIFGGTRTLISEPTGPMTVTMTAVVAGTVAAHPEQGLALAFTVVMLAGLFQIAFGVLKLGRYITLMPYSVISGFMSGIGVLLVITQLAPLLGQATPSGGAIGTLRSLPELVASVRLPELVLAGTSLAILFLVPEKARRYAPPPLVAVIAGTVLSLLLPWTDQVRTIGSIPMGLPRLVLPRLTGALAPELIVDALVLAVLGSIDSLLTSMIADSLTREQHDSNRELIGQGIGNLLSGLLGGLPGAGATMGTVVNIRSGASTGRAGIIRAVLLLAIVLALAPLLRVIPMAVLAAIAVKVGLDILDWSFIGRAHRISLSSTLIMYAVLVVTVLVDLMVAVGVGVFVANILTIERLSNLPSTRVTTIDPAGETVLSPT